MAMAMANGIELETLNLELETMADGEAPLNASTSQRINLCLSPLTFKPTIHCPRLNDSTTSLHSLR